MSLGEVSKVDNYPMFVILTSDHMTVSIGIDQGLAYAGGL